MNVLQYFRFHFPNHPLNMDEEENGAILEEMTLDSPCGHACKQAIDAAVGLCNHISSAYGNEGQEHPTGQEIFPQVMNAAVEVCVCYIRG